MPPLTWSSRRSIAAVLVLGLAILVEGTAQAHITADDSPPTAPPSAPPPPPPAVDSTVTTPVLAPSGPSPQPTEFSSEISNDAPVPLSSQPAKQDQPVSGKVPKSSEKLGIKTATLATPPSLKVIDAEVDPLTQLRWRAQLFLRGLHAIDPDLRGRSGQPPSAVQRARSQSESFSEPQEVLYALDIAERAGIESAQQNANITPDEIRWANGVLSRAFPQVLDRAPQAFRTQALGTPQYFYWQTLLLGSLMAGAIVIWRRQSATRCTATGLR